MYCVDAPKRTRSDEETDLVADICGGVRDKRHLKALRDDESSCEWQPDDTSSFIDVDDFAIDDRDEIDDDEEEEELEDIEEEEEGNSYKEHNSHTKLTSVATPTGSNLSLRQANELGSLLWSATEQGRVEEMKRLLDAGANVNWKNPHECHQTPLMASVYLGPNARKAVQMLLKAGADLEAVDDDGCTALLHACGGTDADTLQLLLDAKADANVFCIYSGQTALMGCASRRCADMMLNLIRARPDLNLNATDKMGRTAAHHCNSIACALILIAAGADLNICDKDGETGWDHLAMMHAARADSNNNNSNSNSNSKKMNSQLHINDDDDDDEDKAKETPNSVPRDRLCPATCGPLEAAVIMRLPDLLQRRLDEGWLPARCKQGVAKGFQALQQLANCAANQPVALPLCAVTSHTVQKALEANNGRG